MNHDNVKVMIVRLEMVTVLFSTAEGASISGEREKKALSFVWREEKERKTCFMTVFVCLLVSEHVIRLVFHFF